MTDDMDDKERRSAFVSAMTTEHFVLQTAIATTINEGASRASIYVFSLSSSLVAMGFAAQSQTAFMPFVDTVLPALFLLGVFTVLRLVDIAAENMQALIGIARIRGYYRTLGSEAEKHFAADRGRWPEGKNQPALRIGPLIGYLTTAASMIASINAIVAGAGVALLLYRSFGGDVTVPLLIGGACAAVLLALFFFYQRYRIADLVDTWENSKVSSKDTG
jgi:uncharacterized protein (DUF2062 family)